MRRSGGWGKPGLSIFDRSSDGHPWAAGLARLLDDADPGRRAVAANWSIDGRVSEEREKEILASVELGGKRAGEGWWEGVWAYFHANYHRKTPEFQPYLLPINQNNKVPRRHLPPTIELVHVETFHGLVRWLRREGDGFERRFHTVAEVNPPEPLPGETLQEAESLDRLGAIAENLNEQGPDAVRAMVRAMFSSMPEERCFWWATFLEGFERYLDGKDATSISRALGLGHHLPGQWLVVWRYTLQDVHLSLPTADLYRPTVLEAGQFGYHFPSPAGYPYGITMPLDGLPEGAYREVIHPPLSAEMAVERCTGKLLKIADPPISGDNDLLSLRQRHRTTLEATFPADLVEAWLQRHGDLP